MQSEIEKNRSSLEHAVTPRGSIGITNTFGRAVGAYRQKVGG